MQQTLLKHNAGFTLIETLFAVLIFSAALVSLLTVAGKGISATSNARDQMVAHYLAQEGLEVVRNIRDTSFRFGSPWDAGFAACTTNPNNPCKVVYGSGAEAPIIEPCGGSCVVQEQNGAFTDTGDDSLYTREITVNPAPIIAPQTIVTEYEIISKVSWESRGLDRSVTLRTLLKKWR